MGLGISVAKVLPVTSDLERWTNAFTSYLAFKGMLSRPTVFYVLLASILFSLLLQHSTKLPAWLNGTSARSSSLVAGLLALISRRIVNMVSVSAHAGPTAALSSACTRETLMPTHKCVFWNPAPAAAQT